MREFFCTVCGLYHWASEYERDQRTGYIEYNRHLNCPVETCKPHDEHWRAHVVSVGGYGYGYFTKHQLDFIKSHGWSALKYVPDQTILDSYKVRGIKIIEG